MIFHPLHSATKNVVCFVSPRAHWASDGTVKPLRACPIGVGGLDGLSLVRHAFFLSFAVIERFRTS